MNNTVTTTVGIDTAIKSLQTTIYDALTVAWGGNIDSYGRVYRNMTNDGSVNPRWFFGSKDYTDVYYNDEFSCVFCFIDSENHTTQDEFVYESDVRVVFMVDLERIMPTETDRGDMEAQLDVVNIIKRSYDGNYKVKGIVKGLRNVFKGFDTSNIKFTDMQPYHCFGIDLKLYYYITEKCD